VSGRDDLVANTSARPEPLATRAPAPRARRLSRRALATLTGAAAIGVAAALGYSLSHSHRTTAPQQTVSIERPKTDALAGAPKDYGDLARTASGGIGAPPTATEPPAAPRPFDTTTPSTPIDNQAVADQQRRRQRNDSARASKLFTGTSEGVRATVASTETPSSSAMPSADSNAAPAVNADPQSRKAAFVAGGAREPTVNSGRLTEPMGRYVISAGSTIAAALITGLSSDLPGAVVAQVTENVFDSATGRTLLIPQGARLIGSYDAHISYGQERALVVWTRLILPDGRSIDLDRMIGTDPSGRSGFTDRVDHHTGTLFKAALLSTLFGLGTHVATGGGNHSDIAFAIRDSASQSVERAGDKLVEHQLDVQPTITIRPGARVRVLVGRDLTLEPWGMDDFPGRG